MCCTAFVRRLALFTLLAYGCAPAEVSYERSLEDTPAPAAHAVHSDRLAQLMRGLELLAFERLPQAMDAEAESEQQAARVADVARALAASARQIPQALSVSDLDAQEREEFLRLKDALAREASALAEEATLLSPSALAARASTLEGSCDHCHRRFRLPMQPDG